MSDAKKPDEIDDVDLLLPWRATGRLDPAESARLDRLIAEDADIARRLALAEEEMDETRAVVEALPAPSSRARDRVFARIAEIEGRRAPARAAGLLSRIGEFFASLSPQTMAWSAAAATVVVTLQAGLIAGLLLTTSPEPGTYGTASGTATAEGTYVLVGFAPGASAAQITALLTERGAAIVEGPLPGGLYRVRVARQAISAEEREKLAAPLRARSDVIAFVAPSQ